MANGDTAVQDEPQLDEFGDPIPTQEQMASDQATQEQDRLKEQSKTAQTLQLVRAMNQTVAPLPMTLPTQAAPVVPPAPPPMTGTQPPPPGTPGYEFGRGIGVLRPQTMTAPASPPAPQGRMYMGPAMDPGQEQQFMQSAPGTRMNLMPPPSGPPSPDAQAAMQKRIALATGGESDADALSRMQAADPPGARTIGIQHEPPYSDASLANQRNAMLYNAMKKFDAGDRSPEVMAAAMGSAAPRTISPGAQASLDERVRHNKATEAGRPPSELVTKVQNGKTYQLRNGQWVHVPDVRNTMDSETQTISPTGQVMETKRTRHSPVQAPSADTLGIPKASVAYLKTHPEAAKSFDQKYGKGAASKILQE